MQIEKFGEGKENDIVLLEKTIGMELPEDYKNFLRQNNGGRPKATDNYLKFEGIKEKIKVTHFFGVSKGGEVVTSLFKLLEFYVNFRGKFLENMLPIAYTYGGHCGVIYYKDEEEEGYYLLDWDLFHKESSEDHYMYKIADTFNELLENIIEEQEVNLC